MTRFAMLCAALVLAMPAAAQDQPAGAPDAGEPTPELNGSQPDPQDFDLARKKVTDCEGEKFVFAWGAGARPTKVTLCSKRNATPEEVVMMLDEAATKLEQTTSIAEDRRVAIIKQIRGKIAELQGKPAAVSEPVAPAVAGAVVKVPKSAFASNDRTPAPPTEYAALPPIAPAVSKAPARTVPLPAKPRLSFECYTPGEVGTGSRCVTMNRDTKLTFRAREALPDGIGLRFRRNGETRAEVPLNAMRDGQRVQLVVPRELCSGVVEAESQIEVIRGGRVVDSIGPYLLRC